MDRLPTPLLYRFVLVSSLIAALTTGFGVHAGEEGSTSSATGSPVRAHAEASGGEQHGGHDPHSGHDGHGAREDHADHADHVGHGEHADHDHEAPKSAGDYEKSLASYRIPELALTDQFGRAVEVSSLLAEDRPTLVQFIFTSCSTICPVMGAVFGKAQDEIFSVSPDFRMVSISIDPEYDTPERLRAFAAKQSAGRQWIFLTGGKAEVMQVVRSFDALYEGDSKMYHQPYTFIRWSPEGQWTRIRGLIGVEELVEEFRAAGG